MNKFVVSLFCAILLLAVYSADARKGPKGGSRRRRPSGGISFPKPQRPMRRPRLPENAVAYSWNVNMTSDDVLIPQKAIVIMEKDAVVLKTFSRELRPLNMSASMVFMNMSTGVVAIKAGGTRGPCFMTTTSATNETVQADLNAWNNTDIEINNNIAFNGSGSRMNRTEAREMIEENPGLRRFCMRSPLIQVEEINSGVSLGDGERMMTLLGYDTMISMVVPARKSQRPGKGGKKGKGGKGSKSGKQGPRPRAGKPRKPAKKSGKRRAGKRRS